MEAAEALMTSAGTIALPVTRIDGQPVGDGTPGPLSQRLRALYLAHGGVADPVRVTNNGGRA